MPRTLCEQGVHVDALPALLCFLTQDHELAVDAVVSMIGL